MAKLRILTITTLLLLALSAFAPLASARELEPGDDRGGRGGQHAREIQPGDDRGGQHPEPGDDRGGRGGHR